MRPDGRRREQVLDVALDTVGGVVAVDEDEVGVAALVGELREEGGQQLVAVARVQLDVGGPVALRVVLEVEGVDLLAGGGDAAEAAALRGADLDRQPRLQRREDSLQRRPFTERHLPVGRLEEWEAHGGR